MRWNVICLTAILGLGGCAKKSQLSSDGASVRLYDAQWRISSTDEGTWKVGKLYRDTVSKNLTVVLELPILSDEDVALLQKSYGVDSWVVKVIQVAGISTRQELVQLYVPFRSANKGRNDGRTVKSISFALTYAASAISERFRRFQCPAFSHDRRLKDWQTSGEATPMEFVVSAAGRFNEKLIVSELVPTQLNIGNTMVGEYYLEAALLNSRDKQLFSPFQRLPEHLKVMSERSVTVSGCAGVHQEYEPIAPGLVPKR